MVYSFARSLHIDLHSIMTTHSWAWFTTMLSGLMSERETMIGAYFANPVEPVKE